MAKLDLAKARQAGYTDDQIQQYAQSKGVSLYDSSAKTTGRSGVASLLPLIGSIGGGIIGSGAGPVGTVGGSAVGGGLGETLAQLLSGEKTDVGKIGSEAALSGLFSGAGSLAGKVLSKPLKTAAMGMRQKIISPKVIASPFAAQEEAKITETVSKYAKGSAASIRNKSGGIVNDLSKQIDDLLKVDNPTIDIKRAKALLKTNLSEVPTYDLSDKVFKTAADTQLKKISTLKTARDVVDYKSKLSGQLSNVFKKIDKGTTLSQREAALLSTWGSLDTVIAEQAPRIKNLTSDMSAFYKAAEGLQSSAARNIKAPFINAEIPGTARLAQGGVSKLAGVLENIPRTGPSQAIGQMAGRTLMGGQSEGTTIPSEFSAPTTETPTTSDGASQSEKMQKMLKVIALMDLLQGSGKNVTKIAAVSKLLGGGTDAATTKKINQLDTATAIISDFEKSALAMNPPENATVARLQGLGTTLATPFGLNSAEARAFRETRKGMRVLLARALGEVGNLSEPEQKAALDLIPDIGDSREEIQLKVQQLKSVINTIKGSISPSDSGDLSSLLGGL